MSLVSINIATSHNGSRVQMLMQGNPSLRTGFLSFLPIFPTQTAPLGWRFTPICPGSLFAG